MSLRWEEDRSPVVGEYLELRAAAGQGAARPAAAAKGLAGGLYCITVREGARLAGMGRVVGDGGLTASLTDIYVHPDWAGRGIGREVLRRILAWCDEALPEGCRVTLMADPGRFALFTEAGFEIRTGMERILA